MAVDIQTKCKTCFGGPRMILHAHWKNTLPKKQYVFFITLDDPQTMQFVIDVWKKLWNISQSLRLKQCILQWTLPTPTHCCHDDQWSVTTIMFSYHRYNPKEGVGRPDASRPKTHMQVQPLTSSSMYCNERHEHCVAYIGAQCMNIRSKITHSSPMVKRRERAKPETGFTMHCNAMLSEKVFQPLFEETEQHHPPGTVQRRAGGELMQPGREQTSRWAL